ncbi:nucleoside phosphorylase domain-containing protein [Aspergillus floccosus]
MTSRSHHDYTVAWICALPLEMAAAKTMLDEIHDPLPQLPTDQNSYTLGKVSGHNVVIACLQPGVYGITSAAIALAHLLPTFPSVKFRFKPTGWSGGVIQYDFGKALVGGRFQQTGFLNKPPQSLLTAMAQVESNGMIRKISLIKVMSNALDKNRSMKSHFPRPNHDHLFRATYSHREGSSDCSSSCSPDHIVARLPRSTEEPQVHYGLIASGDQIMDDPRKRDAIAQQLDVLCVETEAAGLMDQLPCLVIRGICNYCDSHKDKNWQGYAALTAAAYARVLLSVVPVYRGVSTHTHTCLRQGESEEREAFLHWIPTDEYDQMYDELLEKRCPGTCNWMTETKTFQNWRQITSSSLLWCYGKPGIGKSVLLKDLAEPSRMLSAMLKQLYRQKGRIPHEHLRFKQMSLRPSLANLCDIFTSYVSSSFTTVFLLVDAMDECQFEVKHHMIRFLSHILQHVPSIKILAMSRKELNIQEAFQGYPSLAIGKKDLTQDIETYITTKVRQLRRGYHGKKLLMDSHICKY